MLVIIMVMNVWGSICDNEKISADESLGCRRTCCGLVNKSRLWDQSTLSLQWLWVCNQSEVDVSVEMLV
jgi:hypothetical protein